MNHVAQVVPVGVATVTMLGIVELADIDRAEVAGVVGVEKLFTARIAGKDLSHRVHQVVVPVDFIDEGHAGLGVFVRGSHDTVPNVGGEDHSRNRRIYFHKFVKIARGEGLAIAESYGL